MKSFVLPGLDGTDLLLSEFARSAPATHLPATVLTLPSRSMGYEELCEHFHEIVESAEACTLIAESFSGPLAVLLAHRHPNVVRHLVLVATFVTRPTPRIAALLPWSLLFRLPVPSFVARRFLTGANESLVANLRRASRVHLPRTLARRMREIRDVDVSCQLAELGCDITYIRATGDQVVGEKHAEAISGLNRRVMIRHIDGPHLILQTQPELTWQAIVETASCT